MRSFYFIGVIAVMSLINLTTETSAQEISFWEQFALAEDRSSTLEELVPGSQDYYFFHCLHAQNESKLDEVDSLLKRWIKQHGRTDQVQVIENRQALLKYGESPQDTLDYLKDYLKLNFGHRRRIPQAQKDLPSTLDPKLIDSKKIVASLLRQDSNSLNKFHDDGLYHLVDRPLNPRQRRDFLNRIDDPTFPGLMLLIAKDLKAKDSGQFGSLKIHQLLTKAQLESLMETLPQLKSQQAFINEYLLRLQPSEDTNIRRDAAAFRKHLDDMWVFAAELTAP